MASPSPLDTFCGQQMYPFGDLHISYIISTDKCKKNLCIKFFLLSLAFPSLDKAFLNSEKAKACLSSVTFILSDLEELRHSPDIPTLQIIIDLIREAYSFIVINRDSCLFNPTGTSQFLHFLSKKIKFFRQMLYNELNKIPSRVD